VIEAGAAVQSEHRRPLGKGRPVGLELASLDIEEQTDVVDTDPHGM
jgi:hypothetical protein